MFIYQMISGMNGADSAEVVIPTARMLLEFPSSKPAHFRVSYENMKTIASSMLRGHPMRANQTSSYQVRNSNSDSRRCRVSRSPTTPPRVCGEGFRRKRVYLLTRHFLKRVQNKLAVFRAGLTQYSAELV